MQDYQRSYSHLSARSYEFEDFGMVAAVATKSKEETSNFAACLGRLRSWYKHGVGPDWRIARQVQFDKYIVHEVVPQRYVGEAAVRLSTKGCSFGGFRAVNTALKHPDVLTGALFEE